jgi:hypothetical protein
MREKSRGNTPWDSTGFNCLIPSLLDLLGVDNLMEAAVYVSSSHPFKLLSGLQ